LPILTDLVPKEIEDAYHEGRLQAVHLDLYRTFQKRYPFPFDDFQIQAILAILEDRSVIVSAPTGAGKTLVAEFAIHQALTRRKRIAYTTPLKALSNQKYADFCRQFGVAEVGILTGDVKVNPRAPLLVMTTEILRNMFFTRSLPGLGYVVLDECHYMGDAGRGTVWEEIIVNAPDDVQLVALSATVANVTEIADWISLVHRPILPIIHVERPVPLRYFVADLSGRIHPLELLRAGKVELAGFDDEVGHRRGRFTARRVADPVEMIAALRDHHWLPAIYFIFSRAGCERALDDYLAEGPALLTGKERREVEQAIAEPLRESPAMGESELNQTIFQGLAAGVGIHHAGILPGLKRLTELLFERGLVKVVFATETMSLGIHMPAKSVVLQGLTKRTENGFRSLSHNELTQMAGRAGRRGIDPEGQCIIALDSRDSVEGVLKTAAGPPEPIESQFRLSYGSATLLMETYRDPAVIRRTVEASFGQYQNLKRIRALEGEVRGIEASLRAAETYEAPCGDFDRIGRYRALRAEWEAERRTLGRREKAGKGGNLSSTDLGRVVLLRRRGGGELGVVLGVHDLRGGRRLVDALLPSGTVLRVKGGNVKRVFRSIPTLPLPRTLRSLTLERGGGWGRSAREVLARDGKGLLERLGSLSLKELLAQERGGTEPALESIECHRCPWNARPQCDAAWKGIERLKTMLDQRQEALEALKNAYWQEFLQVVKVLEEFDAIDHNQLTRKGRLVAGLRHDNELLVAEVVERGILHENSPPEVAGLLSFLTEESRSGEPRVVRLFLKQHPKLRRKLGQIERVAEALHLAQRQHRVGLPLSVHPGFLPAVYRWASGDDDWPKIVAEAFGGHEGDLIRAMRRLIDLLRQLAEAPEVPDDLQEVLRRAARVIDRGIVLESALI